MSEQKQHTAGVFDIRNVIGALLGLYGVILLLAYAFVGNQASGDTSDNLWAGLILLVVGLVFFAWARLRPIVVHDTHPQKEPLDKPPSAG